MSKRLFDIGEFGLINLIKKEVRNRLSGVINGIGDDAAVVTVSGSKKRLLLTSDMLIEGVHFTKDMQPERIGHKAIACSISDIAAMGGLPRYALISIGVSASEDVRFLRRIYKGILNTAEQYGISIVGGDTVRHNKFVINISLIGEGCDKELVRRAGASVSDKIFVTGPLGRAFQSGWHLRFQPRIEEARYLVKKFKPTAMIDISDGLVADLWHICKESGVSAVIWEESIPKRYGANINHALYDGEDFELLFTLSVDNASRLKKDTKHRFSFYEMGEITQKNRDRICILDTKGRKKTIEIKGYKHF